MASKRYEGGPVAKPKPPTRMYEGKAPRKAKAPLGRTDVRSRAGTNPKMASRPSPQATPKASSKPSGGGGSNPFGIIGDLIGASRNASRSVEGAMKNPTPVIPYTQKNLKSIRKARP